MLGGTLLGGTLCQTWPGGTLPGGLPHLGYPPVRPGQGVPYQGVLCGGTTPQVTPSIRPGWGYPAWGYLTLGTSPSDLVVGGVPWQGWGYPTLGTPHQTWPGGYPTLGNRWSTWYAVVGISLLFMQEDFLVRTCIRPHEISVFHNRHFCQTIWQIFTQGRANKISSKIAPSRDWNQDLWNLLGRRFLKWALFVSCTTSHIGLCSFLKLIEHDFIKAMKIQAGNWMLT